MKHNLENLFAEISFLDRCVAFVMPLSDYCDNSVLGRDRTLVDNCPVFDIEIQVRYL